MGRKLFFANDNDKPKCRNQSRPSGYVFGAHSAEDSIRRKDKRDKKTKRMCREAVQRWLQFTEQYQIEGYKIGPGCPTPDHTLIKEFLRWYIHVAEGKKSESGRVVTSTVLNFAERLPDNEVIGVAAMAPGVNLFDNSVGPFTRAGTRRLRVQLDKSDSLRKELNARQKKKLRELKSQNLTLRKIASHFPDIDRASLRQAWIGMAPSQRCTRSRVKR